MRVDIAAARNGLPASAALPSVGHWVKQLEKPFAVLTDDWGKQFATLLKELGVGHGSVVIEKTHIALRLEVAARDAEAAKRLGAWPRAKAGWLAKLPDDSVFAATWAESEQGRAGRSERNANALADWLQAGTPGVERVQLAPVFRSVARGRGDQALVGLRCSGVGLTGYAQGEVQDASELRAGLQGISRMLLVHPTAQKHLRTRRLKLSTKRTRVPRIPHHVWRLRLSPLTAARPAMAKRREVREAVDMRYWVDETRFVAAAGGQTIETLQDLHRPHVEGSLGKSIALESDAGAKPAPIWLSMFADPRAMRACQEEKPGAWPLAPAVLEVGPGADAKRAVRLSVRVDSALLAWAQRWLR
jgi:hypothetical protein